MGNSRVAARRRQAHRSTVTAVGGVVLIALAVVLTVFPLVGLVVPTALGVLGLVLLLAGVIIGAQLVAENARYHQDQSFYDD